MSSFDITKRETAESLKAELRLYFVRHTADISKTFAVPVWRGSNREKRLLERLGLQEAAEAYHRDIEKKKYEAVIVNKSASTHSVAHARRSGRSAGSGSPKNRKTNLQRLRPDDPLAALQQAVPDSPALSSQQSAALQPIQEAQQLDILPLSPPPASPSEPRARRLENSQELLDFSAVATTDQEAPGGSSQLLRPLPILGPQMQSQPGKEEQPQQMFLPVDTGVPFHEDKLPGIVMQRAAPNAAAEQDLADEHAAMTGPQPQSNEEETEHWQSSKVDLSGATQIKPSAEQTAVHDVVPEESGPGAEDPFAATFPTNLIALTQEEEEADEWDTFQAPEEEAEQAELPEADILENQGSASQGHDVEIPDLMFMLSAELVIPSLQPSCDR